MHLGPRPNRVLVGDSNVECKALFLGIQYGAGCPEKHHRIISLSLVFLMIGKIGIQLSPI